MKARLLNPRRRRSRRQRRHNRRFRRSASGRFVRARRRNVRPRHRRRNQNRYGTGGELVTMANRRKKKNRTRRKKYSRRRGRNPMFTSSNRHRRTFRRRRRSNPGFADVKGLLTKAGWVVAGGVITRSVPAMVLGPEKNIGVTGYIANAATAVGASLLVSRFAGKPAGELVLLGGVAAIGGRMVEDFIGAKLVEFGTIPGSLSGDQQYNLSGEYVPQSFAMPQNFARLPAAAAAAAEMSGPFRPSPWAN